MIEFHCNHCQSSLSVAPELAGKKARCPKCQQVTDVPLQSSVNSGDGITFPPQSNPPARVHPNANATTGGQMAINQMNPPPVANPFDQVQSQGQRSPAQPGVGSSPAANTGSNAPANNPARMAPPVSQSSSPPLSTPKNSTQVGEETKTRQLYLKMTEQIGKIFVGQDELVLGTLVALFSSGHVLIESFPGLGKTLFVRTLGKVLGCDFGRIQFTADLMPSDITGAPIFNMKTQEFRFHAGPVFTQLLLADEINRSPAKTHAALLEIMQEYRVTIDGVTHKLDRPFLVMATQNPIESEGTYNLPEAQLDRFMFKLVMDYPGEQEEAKILTMHSTQQNLDDQLENNVETVSSAEEINQITKDTANVRVEPQLVDYINKIVRMTRQWPQFHVGASPRAGIALMQGARTLAAFYGRDFAIPDDVVQIALQALRHRVVLTAEAEVEGQDVDQLLTQMIRTVEVPRLQ